MKLRYRLLTGIDDAGFCKKVSEALDEGYVLHGSPCCTFDGRNLLVAQAVILPEPPKPQRQSPFTETETP